MKNFSADTQQEHYYIESLPRDLQQEIVRRLPFNGIDFSSFKKACLVSHAWRSFIQNLSRDLLRRYFPYLAVTQPQHFIDVPLRLLAEECQRYQKDYFAIDIALVLAALSGEREIIAAVEDIQIKKRLYILFLANGHSTSLVEFKDAYSHRMRGVALKEAARNGHAEAVKTLLEERRGITADDKDAALRGAALEGHTQVVKTLFKKVGTQISISAKDWAFCRAAEHGHIETVKIFLKKVGADITPNSKGEALWRAAENSDIEMLKILLDKVGAQISTSSKCWALWRAAERGHIEAVKILLKETGGQISVQGKGQALWRAAENGRTEMVNVLLEEIGAQISADDKGIALIYAVHSDHVETVKTLLKKVGTQISTEDKERAMNNAHHLEIVCLILRHQIKEALIKDNLYPNPKVHFFRTILTGIFNALTYRSSLTAGVGCALIGFLVLHLSAVASLLMLTLITLGVEVIKKLAQNAGERALRNDKHFVDTELKSFMQRGKLSELSWKNYCLDTFTLPSSIFPTFLSRKSEGYQMGRAMARKEQAHYEMKVRERRCR